MSLERMHKRQKPCDADEEKPDEEFRTEIGYKIKEIIEKCEQQDFWTVALKAMAARIRLKTNNYKQLCLKFKRNSTDLTEEELDLLSDSACKINNMHSDVCNLHRKYFKTQYTPYTNECRLAFEDAFQIP